MIAPVDFLGIVVELMALEVLCPGIHLVALLIVAGKSLGRAFAACALIRRAGGR